MLTRHPRPLSETGGDFIESASDRMNVICVSSCLQSIYWSSLKVMGYTPNEFKQVMPFKTFSALVAAVLTFTRFLAPYHISVCLARCGTHAAFGTFAQFAHTADPGFATAWTCTGTNHVARSVPVPPPARNGLWTSENDCPTTPSIGWTCTDG